MDKKNHLLSLDDLPILDNAAGLKLAGQNAALAEEILDLFMKELKTEIPLFHTLLSSKNYQELQRRVHKLHGACCYTGTPRLKSLLHTLETELKSPIMENLASILDQLDTEVRLLLVHYAHLVH